MTTCNSADAAVYGRMTTAQCEAWRNRAYPTKEYIDHTADAEGACYLGIGPGGVTSAVQRDHMGRTVLCNLPGYVCLCHVEPSSPPPPSSPEPPHMPEPEPPPNPPPPSAPKGTTADTGASLPTSRKPYITGPHLGVYQGGGCPAKGQYPIEDEEEVSSDQIRSDQIRSDQIRSDQIRSDQMA